MFRLFEPSRAKLWEMTRRYNPVHVAAFLYLLSVAQRRKPGRRAQRHADAIQEPITLVASELDSFCAFRTFGVDLALRADWNGCELAGDSHVLVERETREENDTPSRVRDARRHAEDITVLQLLRYLRRQTQRYGCARSNRYADIVAHNLSTALYQSFLESVPFMLFSDNLHSSRGELSSLQSRSIVQQYMRYHRMMHHLDTIVEPNRFRFVVVPRPPLLVSRPSELCVDGEFLFQPWYRGFHVVVNTTPTKTRCYNRHAELLQGWLGAERYDAHACFEAVILPLAAGESYRSWRYWRYRRSYRVVVVDVLRYEGADLLNVPYERRVEYLSRIRSERTRAAVTTTSWRDAESFDELEDPYASVRGVVARHRMHVPPLDRYEPGSGGEIAPRRRRDGLAATRLLTVADLRDASVFAYVFPVRSVGYDVYRRCTLLPSALSRLSEFRCPHMNLDAAPNRLVVQIYAHTESHYLICAYNVAAHQFEHVASLRRFETDVAAPQYRMERLYVEGARVKTRGLLYARLHFDARWRFLGYEHKATLGKHDVPSDCLALLLRLANVLPE